MQEILKKAAFNPELSTFEHLSSFNYKGLIFNSTPLDRLLESYENLDYYFSYLSKSDENAKSVIINSLKYLLIKIYKNEILSEKFKYGMVLYLSYLILVMSTKIKLNVNDLLNLFDICGVINQHVLLENQQNQSELNYQNHNDTNKKLKDTVFNGCIELIASAIINVNEFVPFEPILRILSYPNSESVFLSSMLVLDHLTNLNNVDSYKIIENFLQNLDASRLKYIEKFPSLLNTKNPNILLCILLSKFNGSNHFYLNLTDRLLNLLQNQVSNGDENKVSKTEIIDRGYKYCRNYIDSAGIKEQLFFERSNHLLQNLTNNIDVDFNFECISAGLTVLTNLSYFFAMFDSLVMIYYDSIQKYLDKIFNFDLQIEIIQKFESKISALFVSLKNKNIVSYYHLTSIYSLLLSSDCSNKIKSIYLRLLFEALLRVANISKSDVISNQMVNDLKKKRLELFHPLKDEIEDFIKNCFKLYENSLKKKKITSFMTNNEDDELLDIRACLVGLISIFDIDLCFSLEICKLVINVDDIMHKNFILTSGLWFVSCIESAYGCLDIQNFYIYLQPEIQKVKKLLNNNNLSVSQIKLLEQILISLESTLKGFLIRVYQSDQVIQLTNYILHQKIDPSIVPIHINVLKIFLVSNKQFLSKKAYLIVLDNSYRMISWAHEIHDLSKVNKISSLTERSYDFLTVLCQNIPEEHLIDFISRLFVLYDRTKNEFYIELCNLVLEKNTLSEFIKEKLFDLLIPVTNKFLDIIKQDVNNFHLIRVWFKFVERILTQSIVSMNKFGWADLKDFIQLFSMSREVTSIALWRNRLKIHLCLLEFINFYSKKYISNSNLSTEQAEIINYINEYCFFESCYKLNSKNSVVKKRCYKIIKAVFDICSCYYLQNVQELIKIVFCGLSIVESITFQQGFSKAADYILESQIFLSPEIRMQLETIVDYTRATAFNCDKKSTLSSKKSALSSKFSSNTYSQF